jgi:SAM-dependent methyltransferase
MWINAVSLREFYTTGQGQVARLMIRRGIRTIWPDVTGQSVLGMGYATPYLSMFRDKAERVLSAMPAPQGVLHWPSREGLSLTALTEEVELPFPDLSIDRLLLVHAVEFTEQVRPLMREAWRVLSGSGRLLVVVPNRRGIWARLEHTPFGHGLPYSPSQLSRLLRETLFTPVQSRPGPLRAAGKHTRNSVIRSGHRRLWSALVLPLFRHPPDRSNKKCLCRKLGI